MNNPSIAKITIPIYSCDNSELTASVKQNKNKKIKFEV